MVRIKPSTIDSWWKTFDLGTLNIASLRYQNAKQLLKKARKTTTRSDYEKAKKQYEEVINILKIDTVTYTEYAEIQKALGEYQSAIESLNIALKIKSNRPKFLITDQSFLYSKLFLLYVELDQIDEAIEQLTNINDKKTIQKIEPIIQKISQGKKYRLKIEEIFKKNKISFTFDKTKQESNKKIKLSYAQKESVDQYKVKILSFLHFFNGALYGTIKSKITFNSETTNKILKELISENMIRHERIFNYHVFFITEEGNKITEEILEELRDNAENVYGDKKENFSATYFGVELFNEISGWAIDQEKEKDKEEEFSERSI